MVGTSIVAPDGAVTDGASPEAIGGFTLVDVPSREEALQGRTCLGGGLTTDSHGAGGAWTRNG